MSRLTSSLLGPFASPLSPATSQPIPSERSEGRGTRAEQREGEWGGNPTALTSLVTRSLHSITSLRLSFPSFPTLRVRERRDERNEASNGGIRFGFLVTHLVPFIRAAGGTGWKRNSEDPQPFVSHLRLLPVISPSFTLIPTPTASRVPRATA